MPGEERMDVGGTGTGQPSEQVWFAIQPQIESLRNDIVCLVPDKGVKNQIKQKFGAKEKSIQAVLGDKMAEVLHSASVPNAAASQLLPAKVNISDLKANLSEEWSQSLEALLAVVTNYAVTGELLNEFVSKKDLYVRKIGASLSAFEQQLLERLKPQRAFEPLDFNRQSLEGDSPFGDDPLSQARNRIEELEEDLADEKRHSDKLEEKMGKLEELIQTRNQEMSELKKQLNPLAKLASALGCEAAKVESSLFELVNKITALEIDNDQLRKEASDPAKLQDHSLCQRQIDELQAEVLNLEAALQQERETVASSAKTIKDLRDAIQSLRDELAKHGIRQPLDYRLRELGLHSDSANLGTSSGTTSSDYRYGSYGRDQ